MSILHVWSDQSKTREERYKKWVDVDINLLKEKFAVMSNRKIAEKLGRTIPSVKNKAVELGLKKDRSSCTNWNKSAIATLKKKYPYHDSEKLADELGVSISALVAKAFRLGITKDTKGYRWRKEDVDFLVKNYGGMKAKDIALALNRTEKAIYSKTKYLNLRKKKRHEN